MLVLATMSPSPSQFDETTQTLTYADKLKRIQHNANNTIAKIVSPEVPRHRAIETPTPQPHISLVGGGCGDERPCGPCGSPE